MKKIVIIYLLLLFTNILIAQDKIEVTKFRTLRSGMVLNFEKPEWSENGKGILVTYTLKNDVITKFNVYSKYPNSSTNSRYNSFFASFVAADIASKSTIKHELRCVLSNLQYKVFFLAIYTILALT